MAGVLLISSLPPQLVRQDAHGNEVGATYQASCIDSWVAAGFDPVSVNSSREHATPPIRTMRVDRDAEAVTQRPHVYLADLLAVAAHEAPDRPFAIVNGDVGILPGSTVAANLAALEPGEFLFSRRLETLDPASSAGTPFQAGYDFFGAHTSDIAKLRPTELIFGAPWWDHFLPLAMHMRGCRIAQLPPAVAHLSHTERWSSEAFNVLGNTFVSEMKPLIADASYRSEYDRIVRGPRFRSRVKTIITKTVPEDRLLRLADLNTAYLDRVSGGG